MRSRLHLTFAAVAGIVALSLLAAGCGGNDDTSGASATNQDGTSGDWPDLSDTSLTFFSYGGDSEEGIRKAWTGPWSKLTSAEVLYDSPTDFAKIKAQVESGNVSWDVGFVDGYFGIANCGTLFEELQDVDLRQVDEQFITTDCGVPVFSYALVNVYDETAFGDNPPSSWADFFDTDEYPGTRAIWGAPTLNGALEAALLADGVPPDQLYPIDLDRAFAKLDTIKDDTVFYDTLAQGTEQLVAGEVAMSLSYNGRAYFGVRDGAHYAPVWNQGLLGWDQIAILKGSRNREAAESQLDYIATPEAQNAFAEETAWGPTTEGPGPQGNELLSSWLATTPENREQLIPIDYGWWSQHYEEVITRWTEWIGS